eukprot:765110-Hanusia_phi.AAC.8
MLKASGRKVAVSSQGRGGEARHGAIESGGMNGSDGIDSSAAPAVCTAVFGHSTQSATHSYVLEWHAGTESSVEADGYIGVMNATTLEENDRSRAPPPLCHHARTQRMLRAEAARKAR